MTDEPDDAPDSSLPPDDVPVRAPDDARGPAPDETSDDASDPTPDGERDAPLSELAEIVGERRERAAEDDFGDLFAEQPVEEVAAAPLWDDGDTSGESAFGAVGEVIEEDERTHVVPKRTFCERCRHFGPPPEVRCTNDGTEIREFVDKDHVRVYSCPIVEERGRPGTDPAE